MGHTVKRRLWAAFLAALATFPVTLAPRIVHAAPPPPPSTLSRYIQGTDLWAMGCNQGRASDAAGLNDAVVILDFGKASFRDGNYGAILFGAGFRTTDQIALAAESYLQGFWDCTQVGSPSFVELAIGTTNCTIPPACGGSATGFEHGQAWALMVQDVNAWIVASGFGAQELASGASDLEVSWDTPARTRDWADGYSSVATSLYYNFGDAAGCPQSGQGPEARACNNGWNQDDVWYVSAGASAAVPLPEIYREDGAMARQWQQINLFSYLSRGGRMWFPAALSQWQACRDQGAECRTVNNTAEQSWAQLYDVLEADPRTAPDPSNPYEFRWATQMSWQGT
jgi:hypothetical protein